MTCTSRLEPPRRSRPTSFVSTTLAGRTSGFGVRSRSWMYDIPAGSELTIDYAMIDGDPAVRMECSCGTPECRKVITGGDWRLPKLRRRYAGYFSRYIQERFGARA